MVQGVRQQLLLKQSLEHLLWECSSLTESPSGLFSVGAEGLLVHRHGERAVESSNVKCLC